MDRMSEAQSRTFRITDVATGSIVAESAVEASSWWSRLLGLIGRKRLERGEALWLPANGVHTFGMRFPIDIVVLDGAGRVLRVAACVPPNRIIWPTPGGRFTLELAAGTLQAAQLSIGSVLRRSDTA